MRSLYIIRHAKSSWEDSDLADVMRPLNGRGRKAAKTMGRYLAKMNEKPDLVVSSPATRAYHTAYKISKVIGYRSKDIYVEPAIYYEGERGVLNTLQNIDDVYQSVFVVGHEPTCSYLIYHLCGEMTGKFPTGSVFKMELDIDRWEDIGEAQGKKIYFMSPKDIKE